jgi:hypothetical protein
MRIVNGSILEADDQYICHIINATTRQCGSTSYYLFEKFPYANCCTERPTLKATLRDSACGKIPGYISIHGNGQDRRFVINMIAQYFPGSPTDPNGMRDGFKQREKYFYRCIKEIAAIRNLKSIAFPYMIGCTNSGGNWTNYLAMLEEFDKAASTQDITVSLYRE